jgi:Arc/MetJ-type ribon-helix-helix transcriptional regulator
MNKHTILLSDDSNIFLQKQVEKGGYNDASEYINELLENKRLKQLPKKLSDLQKMRLFNRKAEQLEQYTLWEYLENNKPSFTIEGPISNNFPNREILEAPLITLRLFRMDNDHISIRNLKQIYIHNPNIPREFKENFMESIRKFNDFLQKKSLFSIQSMIWINQDELYTKYFTYEKILESLIYGELFHFTQMEDYQIIYGTAPSESINLLQFLTVIQEFKKIILVLKEINKKTIPCLKESDYTSRSI